MEEPAGASHARLLLDRLFGREPESTRTMAVLHYVDGFTLEEVARETGLSVSGVRSGCGACARRSGRCSDSTTSCWSSFD
jgi:DNA-directed RNA polymerase specialized sigma24 family protein